MGEHLIKPYEISVWEDKLTQDGFIENKLAVIGSNTMTGLNKVYNPIFHKSANGEKTLSFSLKYQYFDPYSGNQVINPFVGLLTNERKVKLYYDNSWYEFIVKDHTELSEELEWTYTCTDAFVLELSKIGYNITFDEELNNNQGTAEELAAETIKNTDWQIGGVNIGRQLIAEPIYKATLLSTTGIEIINTDNTEETVSSGASIYLFYSYVKNQDGKFIQFIIRDDNRKYQIDDKNIITDTNFRIITDLVYQDDGFYLNNNKIISWGDFENKYQANRLAYGQLNTYDSVMQHTVSRFKADDTDIYKYTEYTYATSDVVLNYITNGNNFNILEDGTLQGWNPYTDQEEDSQGQPKPVNKLELVTNPPLITGQPLIGLGELTEVEGFLQAEFNGELISDSYLYNTIYNSGFEDNIPFINSITEGEKFIFRWRAGTGTLGALTPTTKLGLIVAAYTQDTPSLGYYYKHIASDDIIIQIEGTPTMLNNYIEGGSIQVNADGSEVYIIDDVAQVPSTKYIYKADGWDYVWNGRAKIFEHVTNENYLPYYYLVGEAQTSISNAILTDPTINIGLFIYNTEGAGVYYIQDIQFTRYYEDDNGLPVTYGNAPQAIINSTDYYYVKPIEGMNAEDVITYTSPEALAEALGITVDSIVPLYNENAEKYLSISASKTNCFDILQTIAETFECWIDLVVLHDSNGAIVYQNGKPQKFIYLKEYAGADNYAGFKYGINLQSIERNVNSDEIVTKLIVNDSQSEYTDDGYISIAAAPSNLTGEAYILNFDYYYNQGLLNREEVEADKNIFIEQLSQKNLELRTKQQHKKDLETSFLSLGSKRNVYSELIHSAQNSQTRALSEFEILTGMTYEDYQYEHALRDRRDQFTEEETILKTLGEIYTSSAVINNYSGILTNIEQEYQKIDKELHGTEDGSVEGLEQEIARLIDEKTDFINAFENKYFRFIQEGTWNSSDYIDSELYYLDAVQVSNTSAQPQVSYTINVIELSEIQGFEDYHFDAGEKTYVEDTEFFGWTVRNGVLTPAREEMIVSEIEWHLDEPDQTIITVQNYKTRFEDFFQRISAAVQTVQYNEVTYAKTSSLVDANGVINQTVLLESLNRVSGKNYSLTSDGSVLVDGENILIRNLTNTANLVKINSEGIKVSNDGGQNWNTAIDGQGINIGTVYTGTLNTNEVVIGNNDNPSFRWDKSGISAYKLNQDDTYDLQTYVRYDQYGLYGIQNDQFKAASLQDVLDKAHFAVTWDGFFIKNSYEGGGKVEITSDNDFRVLNTINNQLNEKIKIGALEWDYQPSTDTIVDNSKTYYTISQGEPIVVAEPTGNPQENNYYEQIKTTTPQLGVKPSLYGIRIKNDAGAEVMKTDDDGNITITGTINANAGVFDGLVQVGTSNPYIAIDGENATIKSSLYTQDGAAYGWMIDANGDAVFNNITARGAIKTAVFEYAEIQAVGGVFIFRPSSTIRSAIQNGNDIIVTVEKPMLFKQGQWCKISNYATGNNDPDVIDPQTQQILQNNGLTNVYQISNKSNTNPYEITLSGAGAMIGDAIVSSAELIGGALVDMGNSAGTSNYGIGINSSDNTVNLPARAISLFETIVDSSQNQKVSYNYRGILGTLPHMTTEVNQNIYQHMENTQGIYTDNMYIGDSQQYLAFYEDNNHNKQLKIRANQLEFEIVDEQGQSSYKDITEIAEGSQGEDALNLLISGDNITLSATENGETRAQTIVINYQGYLGTTESTDFALAASPNHYSCNKTGLVNTVVDDLIRKQITITLNSGVSVVKGETGTIVLHFVYLGTTPSLAINKIISWDAKLDARDGSDSIILDFEYGGDKTTAFKNNQGTTTVIPILLSNGTDLLIGKTVEDDYSIVWTDLVNNQTIPSQDLINGKTLSVSAADVEGVGSYSCVISYPLDNGQSTLDTKNYKRYVSFTNSSDVLQVNLMSTIGDKLTNGIGEGIIYPQSISNGVLLDEISLNSLMVWGNDTEPSMCAEGDFYFNTTNNNLYKYENGLWVVKYDYEQIFVISEEANTDPIVVKNVDLSTYKYSTNATPSNLVYVWSFRDSDGNILNPRNLTDLKISYRGGTGEPVYPSGTNTVIGGQFIYINKNVINKKIVILCEVTKN